MKKLLFGVASAVLASTAGVSVLAVRYEDTIRPNVFVGEVMVGGLSPQEAAKKVRTWWETEKLETIKLTSPKLPKQLPPMKPTELGVTLDDAATIAQLPLQGFVDNAQTTLQREIPEKEVFNPVFKPNGVIPEKLVKLVKASVGKPKAARALYKGGGLIELKPEVSGLELDVPSLSAAVVSALERDKVLELPLEEAPKTIPDEQLAEIKNVIAEFSTRFSAGNRPRATNLKLASSIINGVVIPPGEQFSFNGTVGRRTTQRGFRVAGVYLNGRHDTGVGGGICQVSTTLFNAALLSNLEIVQRSNHSMPVPYVPVGRDATVNWGSHDLVLRNNYDTPIAISSSYEPGRLTFRVLGKKDPGLSVKIERSGLKSWGAGVKTVYDSSLPAGKRRVIERGTSGFSVQTHRVVYKDGKVLKREPLGRSHYPGGSTIIAVGPSRPAAPPVSTPPVQNDTGYDPYLDSNGL
ncbi:MAG: VanW family protein [Fimbriimonas sp.]